MTANCSTRFGRALLTAGVLLGIAATAATAQPIDRVDPSRGVDKRVDYTAFTRIGPWDDRNYKVTQEDLALLAPNESELKDPIPVFFRIELRKANPGMLRTGKAQYPRSALQIFEFRYGGYLIGNRLYRQVVQRGDRFEVLEKESLTQEEFHLKALSGNVKVTSPTEASESAIKIHPTDVNKVIAGSNGPGPGQVMWYSTDGGTSWAKAAALPQGNTLCDPTVDWSSDGTFAYTSTLGGCGIGGCNVWVYRSSDGGATWNDLATLTPGDGRRELTASSISDKQYIHVDKLATSPHRDNLYVCWHDNNILKFSRSTDFANTFSAPLTMSSGSSQTGIGCDITSDKLGNVYYFWPATSGKSILVRKSTNGGTSFNAAVTVANTQGSFIFKIPAMETRQAFIYASTDADVSNGAFANSIYVAWTDITAAESATAANNHGRIRVAYSRDGGATWTVRTPHETADANTVDRFHPWLGVGPDGKVYVMFYDTRRSPTRVGVDVFYSVSSDGGNTWPTPTRLTSVLSPQIDSLNEWGDYNGLDVVGNQLITSFTDNRNEGGGAADSIDVYAVGFTIGGSPGNTAPSVAITAPANGAAVQQGSAASFSGTATDAEDGDITVSLTWTSSLDGIIGSGASFSTSALSAGTHTITASVTDSGGSGGSATLTLHVTGASSSCTWPRSDVAAVIRIGKGPWGSFVCPTFCPTAAYAYDIRLKSEASQGGGILNGNDDTALNGVELGCRAADGSSQGFVLSRVGSWGSWGTWASCPQAAVAAFPIVGGRMQIEASQGGGNDDDDTAANSVRAYCGDGTELTPPARTSWGTWNTPTHCPANTAVCGMSTQVEPSQGSGIDDDTALNGVEFYCCAR